MKWPVPEHEKTATLAGLLGVELYASVGLLNLLWHWVARFHPSGSLEGISDFAVKAACRWPGDAGELMNAFREARWVDREPFSRVHDWSDHAENWVHAELAERGELFCDGAVPNVNHLHSTKRAEALRLLAERKREYDAASGGRSGVPGPRSAGAPAFEANRTGAPSPEDQGAPWSTEEGRTGGRPKSTSALVLSQASGAPAAGASAAPRKFHGASVEEPWKANANAKETSQQQQTPTPLAGLGVQKPLPLIGEARGKPLANAVQVAELAAEIDLLVALGGGTFEWWCREVTARKLHIKRTSGATPSRRDVQCDYSQARVTVEGITEVCFKRSMLDAQAEKWRLAKLSGYDSEDLARIREGLRDQRRSA